MGKKIDTVEDRIHNAILTAIDNFITPKNKLAVKSIDASSGRDAASVAVNLEQGERIGNNASFENLSERNNTFHELNVKDRARGSTPDEVSELSVPEAHFDKQSHTHHSDSVYIISAKVYSSDWA